jgi:hypothetical protein
MKNFLALAMVMTAFGAVAFAEDGGVAPETELTTLKRGFELVFRAPIDIPINGVGSTVFVYQSGKLHSGMYVWRDGKFAVSNDPLDPARDEALDPARASCQIHIDHPTSPWAARQNLVWFAWVGTTSEGRVSLYTTFSPNRDTMFTCLAPELTTAGVGKFRAADLLEAFGPDLLEIRKR